MSDDDLFESRPVPVMGRRGGGLANGALDSESSDDDVPHPVRNTGGWATDETPPEVPPHVGTGGGWSGEMGLDDNVIRTGRHDNNNNARDLEGGDPGSPSHPASSAQTTTLGSARRARGHDAVETAAVVENIPEIPTFGEYDDGGDGHDERHRQTALVETPEYDVGNHVRSIDELNAAVGTFVGTTRHTVGNDGHRFGDGGDDRYPSRDDTYGDADQNNNKNSSFGHVIDVSLLASVLVPRQFLEADDATRSERRSSGADRVWNDLKSELNADETRVAIAMRETLRDTGNGDLNSWGTHIDGGGGVGGGSESLLDDTVGGNLGFSDFAGSPQKTEEKKKKTVLGRMKKQFGKLRMVEGK